MAVSIIPHPNKDNALHGGPLDNEWMKLLVDRANIFNNMQVIDQNGQVLGQFQVTDNNIILVLFTTKC